MNKLTSLLLLASGLWANASAAQHLPPGKTEYLDADFAVLPSPAGAQYRRQTEYRDSVGGTVRQYYLSGQLQNTAAYEHLAKGIMHGPAERWHENGQLAAHEDYAHGQLAGERRLYYATGQFKRYEQYQGGQRTIGECYDEQGEPLAFCDYEVLPVYPEGLGDERAIIAAIARGIHYPVDALAAHAQGQVFVRFVVTKEGKVDKVQVTKGVMPSLDAETVHAVQQLRAFRPALQDGVPAAVSFTVPVSYSLAPGRTLVDNPPARK